ncbi:hypothetical protein TSMG0094 [Halocynthia phage JM-2012]|uniref:hypothetical protein n=1 Tax=Halocynthia phage JM-2012 TaxID=1173297 RepID=UPI00025C6932|nr:hypothetical protein TSMG0094 [Halocynthia phage JM-2012]AFI55377.1 hypothetical protein TSMG0094 [Halocynthia phage JM-2012]
MKTNNVLVPATATKFLPTVLTDEIALYQDNKDKEIHPLVADVAAFDRSYDFTDDGKVWANAHRRKEELTTAIYEAPTFTEEQKGALYTGLTLRGHKRLVEVFPELNSELSSRTKELMEVISDGEYDEERIENTINLVNQLKAIFDNTSVQSYSDFLIKTRSISKYGYNDLADFKKLCLSKKSNDLFNELVPKLCKEDIEYVRKLKSLLSPCVNAGTENSPNYQTQTLVPDIDVYIRYLDINEIPVMKISTSTSNWNIVVILD